MAWALQRLAGKKGHRRPLGAGRVWEPQAVGMETSLWAALGAAQALGGLRAKRLARQPTRGRPVGLLLQGVPLAEAKLLAPLLLCALPVAQLLSLPSCPLLSCLTLGR